MHMAFEIELTQNNTNQPKSKVLDGIINSLKIQLVNQ
jgi:hypothetical protein